MKYTKIIMIAGMLAGSVLSYAQPAGGGGRGGAPAAPVTMASATQDLKKYEGYFTFYYDEKTGKVLLEVDKWDVEFLYFTSLTDGAGRAAERGRASANIAKFQKVGPKVFLTEPNYAYRAMTTNVDEIKAVENAFAKSVIGSWTPVATEGTKVLIDITAFIVRDSQGIAGGLAAGGAAAGGARGGAPAGGGGAAYRVDDTRSAVYLPNTKNFPKNTEFEAILTFTGGAAGGGRGFGGGGGIAPDMSAITVKEHQSFVELPEAGYQMRKFDPRSSFNVFTYMDFSTPMTELTTKKFTRRHRLAKKDPSARVSEAVEPIIYYVDRGAPANIKQALIEGGNFWNQAFEAAGYKDAFQVKELPEGADPMDIRYNVVNWINRAGSPRAFSSGASYSDPRTGEIIKGVVTLGSDRHRQDFLIAQGLLQPFANDKESAKFVKQMEDMALSRIRQLSAHEIGHTLGFTHNFAASPKDRASVMDYPFPKITLKSDNSIDLSDAYAKGIGEWDKRAIMWGYADFPKGTDEDVALDKIMDETIKLGFQYIPDIGGYTHPASHQWDDGAEPIAELEKLMKVRRITLDKFSENAIRKGEPMATIEEVLVPIYLLHRYQIEAVAKSIGGLYFTHALKGDALVPTKMVDPAQQWKAFDALMATISPAALALPDGLISKIPPRPTGYAAGLETFAGKTGPTFDPIAAAESAASETISSLLNAERAARLIEYKGRDSKQPGFLAVSDKLIEQTWKAPVQAGYAGELQTMVNNLTLKYLLQLSANAAASEVVRGQAMLKVSQLKEYLSSKLASAPDEQKANITFALSQIGTFESTPDKFQTADPSEMPPGAPIMPAIDFLKYDDIQY
ncbi:MAG TPA: zinc-dependent metalloprotease [Cyclobacteriaceae bacterium]|nr:zinc-dependent metalloprotease [Cyclobacteriaceae bacterium]